MVEKLANGRSAAGALKHLPCQPGSFRIAELVPRAACHLLHHGRHSRIDLFAVGLRDLDVCIQSPGASLPIQILRERQQTGGLACLARGVEQEALLLLDEAEHFLQVPKL